MTKFVEFTIPTIDRDQNKIDDYDREVVEATVIGATAKYCGGATVTEGDGYYYHDDGTLAVENVTIVKGFVFDKPASDLHHFAIGTAEYIANKLRQESVIVNISGNVTFVKDFTDVDF